MTKKEFIELFLRWSHAWDEGKARGDADFGLESDFDDWIGSLTAFAALNEVACRHCGGFGTFMTMKGRWVPCPECRPEQWKQGEAE